MMADDSFDVADALRRFLGSGNSHRPLDLNNVHCKRTGAFIPGQHSDVAGPGIIVLAARQVIEDALIQRPPMTETEYLNAMRSYGLYERPPPHGDTNGKPIRVFAETRI